MSQNLVEEQVSDLEKDSTEIPRVPNPFYYKSNSTPSLILEILFLPLLLVKFILIILLFLLSWGIAKLGTLGLSDQYIHTRPLSSIRAAIFTFPLKLCGRLILFIFGHYYIKVKGRENLAPQTEAPVVICCPHSTFLDPFFAMFLYGRFSGFGKAEVKNTPFYGAVARFMQTILVERSNATQKEEALNEYTRRVNQSLAKGAQWKTHYVDNKESQNVVRGQWPYFLTYPEGTCTNRTRLIQFKRGAFVPGSPIQLVLLRHRYGLFDPTWTSASPHRLLKILRLLNQPYNSTEVEICPVYIPNEEEKSSAIVFATNVRKVASLKLNIPTSEHSYEDSFLSKDVLKFGFDVEKVINFEFHSVKARLAQSTIELSLSDAKRWLKLFVKGNPIAVKGTIKGQKLCVLTPTKFRESVLFPSCQPVLNVFNEISYGKAAVEFKDYLYGMQLLAGVAMKSHNISDLVSQAFDKCAETDTVNREQFVKTLLKYFQNENVVVKHKSPSVIFQKLFEKVIGEEGDMLTAPMVIKFLEQHPEYLVLGLECKTFYQSTGEKIKVWRSEKYLQ